MPILHISPSDLIPHRIVLLAQRVYLIKTVHDGIHCTCTKVIFIQIIRTHEFFATQPKRISGIRLSIHYAGWIITGISESFFTPFLVFPSTTDMGFDGIIISITGAIIQIQIAIQSGDLSQFLGSVIVIFAPIIDSGDIGIGVAYHCI